MGFWSSVGSALSSVGSAISSAMSTVSSAISSIGSFAMDIVPKIAGALGTVGMVIQAVAAIVGLFKPEENIEEMGDRALQASESGIRPENFDEYDDYLDAIRNFDLDPDKSESYSPEAKKIAGMGIACKGIEEKFLLQDGAMGAMSVLIAANSIYFNSERIADWLQSGVDIANVVDYFDNKLSAGESADILDEMIVTEQQKTDKTEQEVYTEILDVKDELYQPPKTDDNTA